MSHILAEWPMNRENLEEPMATGQYQQLACLYMPIEIFRAGAQTFKDFKSRTEDERKMASAWRAYVSVFNALAEKARWLFGAKVTLKLEQVMHKDLSKQETLGYMWWLLYTPPPPVPVDKDDPNSEYVAVDKETLDWIAYRDVIGHYQNTVVAPKNSSQYGEKISTAKILSGNAFSRISDAWRKIPSYETWSDFVSLVVGWDHVKLGTGTQPDLAVTRFDFSPEAAFAMHQDDVCWAQSIARMVPKTGGSHGGYLPDNFREKPTFCVTWADSRRVYNVPEDLISTSQLSVMMMPHCQKVRSETACQLRILLPRLVSACAAELTGDPNRVEEDTVMVIVDTDAEEIERLRSEVLVKTKRCNSKRQRLAQISGAHKLMSNNGSAGLVEGITERKMTATPYHPIAGATSDVRNKVVKHIAPYDTLAARKISIIARNAALSSYEMQSLYSPLMSDAMRTILDAIDRDDLLNITDDVRKYFRRPKDLTNHCNGLSPLASFLRKFLVGMENVKHINHLHRYCLMAEICAMDSPRFALDLHLHLLLMSHKGGIGKSLIWAIMKYLMIEGTVLTPTYRTGAASTGADENGNYNFGSDCVVNMDELASSSMKPRPGEANDIVARLKYELSNGCIEVSSVKFDDDGRRITTTEFIVRSLVYMASSNSLEVEIAMGRRWWLPVLPEEPPGERHAADTMNQAALDPKEIQIVDKVMQRVYHFKHAVIAHAEKMIQSGILPEPSDDICGILNLALTQRLRDNQFYVEPNITVFQRLRIIARQQCIWRAVVDAFCIEHHENGLVRTLAEIPERVTPAAMVEHLPRRLFITIEDFVFATGMLCDEIMNPLEVGVRVAISTIFKERASTGLPLMNQFFTEAVRDHSSDSAHGYTEDQKTDYNYASFDIRHLVQLITMILPTIMNGFYTNTVTIRKVLDDFIARKVYCRTYDHIGTDDATDVSNFAEADTGEKRTYAAARIVNNKYLVHCHFMIFKETIDALNQDADTAKACSPTGGVLKKIMQEFLSAKCMLPRRLAFGPRVDDPSDMFSFDVNNGPAVMRGETEKAYNKRWSEWHNTLPDDLSVNLVTRATADTFKIFPELKEMIPDADRLTHKKLIINQDLDTYAHVRHNEKLFITPEPIPKAFRNGLGFQQPELAEMLSDSSAAAPQSVSTGLPQPSRASAIGPHFAGAPLHRISPDEYARWVTDEMPEILASLRCSSEGVLSDDIDFDPLEFTYYGVDENGKWDNKKRKHWKVIADTFAPSFFGYEAWCTDDEETLARQYKMIAFHPVIREHLREEMGV